MANPPSWCFHLKSLHEKCWLVLRRKWGLTLGSLLSPSIILIFLAFYWGENMNANEDSRQMIQDKNTIDVLSKTTFCKNQNCPILFYVDTSTQESNLTEEYINALISEKELGLKGKMKISSEKELTKLFKEYQQQIVISETRTTPKLFIKLDYNATSQNLHYNILGNVGFLNTTAEDHMSAVLYAVYAKLTLSRLGVTKTTIRENVLSSIPINTKGITWLLTVFSFFSIITLSGTRVAEENEQGLTDLLKRWGVSGTAYIISHLISMIEIAIAATTLSTTLLVCLSNHIPWASNIDWSTFIDFSLTVQALFLSRGVFVGYLFSTKRAILVMSMITSGELFLGYTFPTALGQNTRKYLILFFPLTGVSEKYLYNTTESGDILTSRQMFHLSALLSAFVFALLAIFLKEFKTKSKKFKESNITEQNNINLQNVFMQYNDNPPVLKDVNFNASIGSLYTILGRNGAGKTTLMKIMSGILKPTQGKVSIFGMDPSINIQQISSKVAYCSQENVLWDVLTVGEHLRLVEALLGVENLNVKGKLDEVGLVKEMNVLSKDMSGGLKRRLNLVLCDLQGCSLFLLDEPTSGVDEVTQQKIWKYIEKLKMKAAVILATHLMEEAYVLSNHICFLHEGVICLMGTPEELQSQYGQFHTLKLIVDETEDANLATIIKNLSPNYKWTKVAPGHYTIDFPSQEIHCLPALLQSSSVLTGFHWHINNNVIERLFCKICPDKCIEDVSMMHFQDIGNIPQGTLDFHSKNDGLFMEHLKITLWKNYKLSCRNWKLSLCAFVNVVIYVLLIIILSGFMFMAVSKVYSHRNKFSTDFIDFPANMTSIAYYQPQANVDKTLLSHTNTILRPIGASQDLINSVNSTSSKICTFFIGDLNRDAFDVVYSNPQCMNSLLQQYQYGLLQLKNDYILDTGYLVNDPSKTIPIGFLYNFISIMHTFFLLYIFYSLMQILIGRLMLEEKEHGLYFTQRLQGILPNAFWLGNLLFHMGFIITITATIVVPFKTLITSMTVNTHFPALILAIISMGCFWIGVAHAITTLFKKAVDFYPDAMGYTFVFTIFLNTDIEPLIYASPMGLFSISYKSGLLGQTSCLTTWIPICVLFMYAGLLVGISVLIEESQNGLFHWKKASKIDILNPDGNLKHKQLESQALPYGISNSAMIIDNISKVYGTKQALSNVSLSLPLDMCTGLLGPNGSGKTTLIKLILGMEKQSSGGISNAFNSKIGYCPQFPTFWKELTVYDHLFIAASISGAKNWKVNNEWVLMVARFIGLDSPEVLKMKPSMLSGGMQKRLAFGMAIMGRPQFLILDEPTTGVDPVNRAVMWKIIQQYKNNDPLNPVSILLTSHFLEEVDILCQRVAILKEGCLECVASQLELKKRYGEGYNLTCYIPLQFETSLNEFDATILEQKQILLEEEMLSKLNKGLAELLSISNCGDLFCRQSLRRRRFSKTDLPKQVRLISWSLSVRFILPFSKVSDALVSDVIRYFKKLDISEWSFGMIELSEVFRNVICNSD